MVDAGSVSARGDREVDRRVLEHPLGVVGLVARGLCREQLVVEGDALGQIIDMQMDVKALAHEFLLGVGAQGLLSGRQALPWQQFSVR